MKTETMWRIYWGVVGALIGTFITVNLAAISSDKDKKLSEISELKAQNWQLKVTVTQCQQQLTTAQLGFDRDSLVKEFRKELDADDKQEFDWKTLTFKSTNPTK